MEERRQAWAARGWDYVHVLVKEDEPKVEVAAAAEAVEGLSLEEPRTEGVRLPTRVWGEHQA